MRAREPRRESGSALFVALLMLVLMGFLGIAALDTVRRDQQVAGFQNQSRSAFYAAEAGVADARSMVSDVFSRSVWPVFPHTQGTPRFLGDVALYDRETDRPKYYGDPDAPNPAPIAYLGGKERPPEGFDWSGSAGIVNTFWQVNVVGESPDGSRSRLEVIAIRGLQGSPPHSLTY